MTNLDQTTLPDTTDRFSGLFAGFRTSIRTRLNVITVAVGVLPVLFLSILLGVLVYNQMRVALLEDAFNQLEAARTLKVSEIESWLAAREGDALFARNLVVVKGTAGVNEGLSVLAQYKNDPSHTAYVEAFSRAEKVLGSFAAEIGGGGIYADIMLVDLEGDVVFALDVASRGDNEADSPAFQNGLQSLYTGDIVYVPVHDELNLRITAPVTDDSGETVGVIFLELKLDTLNNIMNERVGLGESGETYLVGQDNLFRSESRFLDQLGVDGTILNTTVPVDTIATQDALAGGSGTQIIDDYRGVPVLSSWSSIVIHDEPDATDSNRVVWALMAEIDEAEVLIPVNRLTNLTGGLVILITLIVGAVVVAISTRQARSIAQPIVQLAESAKALAGGDWDAPLPEAGEDEIGQLTASFVNMTGQLQQTLAELEQRALTITTSAEVSRRLSTILDEQELLTTVVEQVQNAFNYYHAHIYLVNEADNALLMAGGTGEASAQMLAHGHRIPVGKGLVGRAAETNMTILVPDVSQEEGWLPNPLLPETKAEVAVPIAIGGQTLGVLDVQHNVIDGLRQTDASLLESVAGQVAIALQNARAYQQTQHLAEQEALTNVIRQQLDQSDTVEDVLQVAVRELGRALGAEETRIRLQTETIANNGNDHIA
ncbi:MAG: GAF domain-containing protein [Chloroflexi bacterium]|nr:GAF domain-containing protein [Chloroflexota bacterium]